MLLSKQKNDIDFVVLWVEGNDPEWQSELNKYRPQFEGDTRTCRYRDWGNLKYLFRGFDQCTPWVRKIHFVTWGHLPPWLNCRHEKLNIVRHKDFLLKENLPVFSSHPIELNLHRIPGLAEKFVYFNDDMFLLSPINMSYFFKNGIPKDMCVFNAIFLDSISHVRLSCIEVVDKWFSKRDVMIKNVFKIFNSKYGLHQLRTLCLLPWPQMTGFYDPHQPQPFLKKTFEEVWFKNNDILTKTSASRFRSKEDVSQYLFRYWQLLKGEFYPRSFSDTHTIPMRNSKDVDIVAEIIKSKKYTMLCINDEIEEIEDNLFISYKENINQAFGTIFSGKSSFEL
ncbi:MAG: glycosyl transferase [Geobacter sp.]|nr:MAG: glycosyl transferase [Geobacter sp.]